MFKKKLKVGVKSILYLKHDLVQKKNCPDRAVTVLRKPSQRIISAFHAGFFVPRIKLPDRREIWKTVRTAADFLRAPPAQSCATKMVLYISFENSRMYKRE